MTTQVTGSGVNFNGSTSGTILLTQPAVAGSNTITLPAETGTARTTVSSGTVLQVVNYQTGAVATGSTQMPYDDTIPQITEGNEYMTLAITPRSAASTLIIQVGYYISSAPGATYTLTGALFQDAIANALAAISTFSGYDNGIVGSTLFHKMTSPGTGTYTFRFRAGINAAGTTTLNGQQSGLRRMGGVGASSITITEVVP